MEVDIQFQKYVQKMCRSCLNPNVNLTSILDPNLKDLFRKMTDLEVTLGGIFPLKLCDSCVQILTKCQHFRESCRTNDMVVKFNYKIKTEKGCNETENVSQSIVKSEFEDVFSNTDNIENMQDNKPVIKEEFEYTNYVTSKGTESPFANNVSLKRKESPHTVTAIKILKRNVRGSASSLSSNVSLPPTSSTVNITRNSSFNVEEKTVTTSQSTTVLEPDSSINMESINEIIPNKKAPQQASSKSKGKERKSRYEYMIKWRAKRVALHKQQEAEFLQNCKDNNFEFQPKDNSENKEPCLIPWNQEDMAKALEAVCVKKMSCYTAYRIFGVSRTILERLVYVMKKLISPVHKVFEEELVDYCNTLNKRFFGASENDIFRTLHQLYIKKKLKNPFLGEEAAEEEWLNSFIRRNVLEIQTTDKLRAIRAKMEMSDIFPEFFDMFEEAVKKTKSPSRLFNCDSSGITICQNRKVGESDSVKVFTIIPCMNPNGTFVPPLVIFPKKLDKGDWKRMPAGSICAFHSSGSIQKEIFIRWFQHFIVSVKPTEDDPVVLVYDGRHSHARNIEILNLARENHVEIVCLPPQGTHLIQPIDIIFIKTFKAIYTDEVNKWMAEHPNKDVLQSVGRFNLLTKAYERAATTKIAAQGFKISGLYPCNRNCLALDIS